MTYPLELDTAETIATKVANIKPFDKEEISEKVKHFEQAVQNAQEAFDEYLTSIDYINKTTGNYEDTRYWRIHPYYYQQWKSGQTDNMPPWAVIRD